MFTCPHCSTPGISLLAKWWSGSSSPAVCAQCGEHSYVRTSESTGIHAMASLLLAAVTVGSVLTGSLAVFLGGAALAAAYYVLAWRSATLVPVSAAQAAVARRHGWLFLAAVPLVCVLVYLVQSCSNAG
jgi:hypothetical protein